jgi:hypothetical protein
MDACLKPRTRRDWSSFLVKLIMFWSSIMTEIMAVRRIDSVSLSLSLRARMQISTVFRVAVIKIVVAHVCIKTTLACIIPMQTHTVG